MKTISFGRKYSAPIGGLFIAAFFLYGGGTAVVTSVVGGTASPSTISAQQTTLALGVFLMLLNSMAVVALGVLLFPILERHGGTTALAYLAARIVEGVFLALGALSLLLIPQLGGASLAIQSNTLTYQVAEMSLAVGSIFMCSLLFRTRLVPRSLAIAGVIGYAIFLTGTVAEIFAVHIGLVLSVPGGLFELAFAVWLLAKGFQTEGESR